MFKGLLLVEETVQYKKHRGKVHGECSLNKYRDEGSEVHHPPDVHTHPEPARLKIDSMSCNGVCYITATHLRPCQIGLATHAGGLKGERDIEAAYPVASSVLLAHVWLLKG
eukprot:1158274-Pelagomonas_calceolata.AAC.64